MLHPNPHLNNAVEEWRGAGLRPPPSWLLLATASAMAARHVAALGPLRILSLRRVSLQMLLPDWHSIPPVWEKAVPMSRLSHSLWRVILGGARPVRSSGKLR